MAVVDRLLGMTVNMFEKTAKLVKRGEKNKERERESLLTFVTAC